MVTSVRQLHSGYDQCVNVADDDCVCLGCSVPLAWFYYVFMYICLYICKLTSNVRLYVLIDYFCFVFLLDALVDRYVLHDLMI